MKNTSQIYAEIAVDVPLRITFTYVVPKTLEGLVARGRRVLVPFHKQKKVGICVALRDSYTPTGTVSEADLKEILAADEQDFLTDTYLSWLEFAADYYVSPLGAVLSQAIPPHYLDQNDFELSRKRKSKEASIKNFVGRPEIKLNPAQTQIVEDIAVHHSKFYPVLIRGVTGSGKTEVYIELIKQALERGESALYLVPEIGLTPQTLSRLNAHFAGKLLIFHSALTPNQRLSAWQRVRSPEPVVLVGTRSALFAPFQNLGVIVIDEEHDSSYKQEERFRYNARDLAVVRASLEKIPIIMGSATPSLESYHQALQGRYHYFELKERIGQLPLPHIDVIDIGREKEQTGLPLNLSQNIIAAIREHLAKGEQIILFVGQRGYAQNAFCLNCHKIQTCLNCSVGLKFHSHGRSLKCHYCDFEKPFDEVCLYCNAKSLTLLGMGIQSIEEEISVNFPGIRMQRVDSDSFPSAIKLEQVLESFSKRDIDLIIGTHMMSKGHDFDNVGFVGIVGIDAHLGLPDFRAAERSFQTLVQVAGRSGRKGKQGRVLVQSYFPQHLSLKFAIEHDYESFARYELSVRETLHYPPFYRLVQIRLISNKESELKNFSYNFDANLRRIRAHLSKNGIEVLGPTEMPIYKLRGKFRLHLLLKIPRKLKTRDVTLYVLSEMEKNMSRKIQAQIDVDPVSLL